MLPSHPGGERNPGTKTGKRRRVDFQILLFDRGFFILKEIFKKGAEDGYPDETKNKRLRHKIATSYNRYKEYQGQRYTGMTIGCSQRWHLIKIFEEMIAELKAQLPATPQRKSRLTPLRRSLVGS